MKTRPVAFVACSVLSAALLACQGKPAPPPPPPAPPTTATAVPAAGAAASFTATVVVAPGSWTYTVTSATGSNINSIEIIAPRRLDNCTLTPPAKPAGPLGATAKWTTTMYTTPAGRKIPTGFSDPTGLVTVTFTITCDAPNGPIYLHVTDIAGTTTTVMIAGASVLGPIAGPT